MHIILWEEDPGGVLGEVGPRREGPPRPSPPSPACLTVALHQNAGFSPFYRWEDEAQGGEGLL